MEFPKKELKELLQGTREYIEVYEAAKFGEEIDRNGIRPGFVISDELDRFSHYIRYMADAMIDNDESSQKKELCWIHNEYSEAPAIFIREREAASSQFYIPRHIFAEMIELRRWLLMQQIACYESILRRCTSEQLVIGLESNDDVPQIDD